MVWGLIFTSLLFFSSCINIEENFHFNRDGSGSMWIKMDIGDMMAMMGGFMEGLDEEGGEDTEDLNMDELFDNKATLDRLSAIPGVSNVKSLNDQEEGIIGYSYDFSNISALNSSMTIVNEEVGSLTETGDSESSKRNFVWEGKKFTVDFPKIDLGETEEEGDEELDASMEEMMMGFMKEYTYKTTYSFEQPIKKAKNKEMVLSSDKKSVTIEKSMADLMDKENPVELGGLIKLKK